MNEDISLGLAIIIVFFLLLGSGVTLIGAIGLVRAQNFYQRLHMPTLATSCGVGSIIIASIIYSFYVGNRIIIHEILLSLFLIITTPVTLMLISRASMHRDQSEDWLEKKHDSVPQSMEEELEKFKKQYEMPARKTTKTTIKAATRPNTKKQPAKAPLVKRGQSGKKPKTKL